MTPPQRYLTRNHDHPGHDWTVGATVRVFIRFCTTITAIRSFHNLAVRAKILVLMRF